VRRIFPGGTGESLKSLSREQPGLLVLFASLGLLRKLELEPERRKSILVRSSFPFMSDPLPFFLSLIYFLFEVIEFYCLVSLSLQGTHKMRLQELFCRTEEGAKIIYLML
jgi:hypothetical protein